MSKEKLYALRDQLSKSLYDPTPEQSAQRDKMWKEGRFEEIFKDTKRKEEQLDYVEKQIEAVEAAEPEIGEKISTNVLLNLPWGRAGKFPGLGSLLGIAEEEVGAAETQRLKDIEQELNKLNAIRQRDLEGGRVSSGTISGIDAGIEKLMGEKEGIMSMIGKTPTTGEVKPGTLIPSIKQELKTDLDLKKDYAEFFNPPTPIKGVRNVDIKKNLADFKTGKISASEARENMSLPYTTEEINKLEKDEFKSAFRLAEEKWQETKSEYHKEAMRQLGVRAYGKGYLKGDIGWTDLGYQGGGLVMNYGDYGRSYK